MDKFPSIDNVHEVLSDLNGLFEDRNALLNAMFKEDKYKEFLLAENIQSLVEADKRDDSAGGKIKRDLADGYEVLKAQTTMRKFANFISPGSLQTLDLSDSGDYDEPEFDDRQEFEEEEQQEPQSEPEKGEKGDKGDPGDTTVVEAPKSKSPFPFIADGGATSQKARMALKEGGAVAPSPMQNFLNPGAQRPETKSGVKSLESLGLVGKKNVASELTEDLGLDEYKKALADAMALPLKAVAAGLAGLMDKIDVPGGETAALEGQISSIGKAFDVPTKKKKKENKLMNFVQGGGIFGALGRMLGGGKKKKQKQQTETQVTQSSGTESSSQVLVAGEPYDPDNPTETQLAVLKMQEMMKGGPSLGKGGATHEKVAPDQLSNQGDTRIDAMKSSIRNITQGAKNMFMNSKAVTQIKGATGFVSKLLSGIQPASKGSQYNTQNINELTDNVTLASESAAAQKTKHPMGYNPKSQEEATEAMLAEIAKIRYGGIGINESDALPPAPLKVSKYLIASITSAHGGETPNDIL
tara:strand:- start:1137 stop:2711 length:1575 start_codon:yes stop_codon:yes gene_type:complete